MLHILVPLMLYSQPLLMQNLELSSTIEKIFESIKFFKNLICTGFNLSWATRLIRLCSTSYFGCFRKYPGLLSFWSWIVISLVIWLPSLCSFSPWHRSSDFIVSIIYKLFNPSTVFLTSNNRGMLEVGRFFLLSSCSFPFVLI